MAGSGDRGFEGADEAGINTLNLHIATMDTALDLWPSCTLHYVLWAAAGSLFIRLLYGLGHLANPANIGEPHDKEDPPRPPSILYCLFAPIGWARRILGSGFTKYPTPSRFERHAGTPFEGNDSKRAQKWFQFHSSLGLGAFTSFDAWTGAVLGFLQFLIFPYLIKAGAWVVVAGWLAAQIAVGWSRWQDGTSKSEAGRVHMEAANGSRRDELRKKAKRVQIRFNHFLIATGFVVMGSYVMANTYLGHLPDGSEGTTVVDVHPPIVSNTTGITDSTLLAMVKDGNATLLQAMREEHKAAFEQLKEMKQQPPMVIGTGGGGWFSWPFALVLLVLCLIAVLGYLGKGAHDAKLQRQLAWIAAGATVFTGLAGIYAAYLQQSHEDGAGGPTVQNVNNYGCPCPEKSPCPTAVVDTTGIIIELDSLRIALGDLKQYISVHCGKGGGSGPVTLNCPEFPDLNVDMSSVVIAIEELGDRLDSCCESGSPVEPDLKCIESELAFWHRLTSVMQADQLIQDSTKMRLCARMRDVRPSVRKSAFEEVGERCREMVLHGERYYIDRDSTLLQLERQAKACGRLTFPRH